MKKIHDVDFDDDEEVCEQTFFELSNNKGHDWEEDGDEE
jgi:hypothetical protein